MKTKVYAGLIITLAAAFVFVAGCRSCGSSPDGKCGTQCAMKQGGQVQTKVAVEPVIGTEALQTLLRAKTSVTLLDARSGKYDDGQRVPGAQSLNAGSPAAAIAKVLPDKQALVVTYCAGLTCPASHQLAERLVKLGYVNVIEYPEGIAGWIKAGNKVEVGHLEK